MKENNISNNGGIKMRKIGIGLVMAVILGMFALGVTYEDVTVSYIIPSDVTFTTTYGGSCGTADFACVENDGVYDGDQARINITQTDGTICQDAGTYAVRFTNSGNENINITAKLTASQADQVSLKFGGANAAYEATCNGTSTATSCVNITTSEQVISANITVSGTGDVWGFCDFVTDFNGGLSGTVSRTLRLNSTGY